MRWGIVVVVGLSGCGRLGFDDDPPVREVPISITVDSVSSHTSGEWNVYATNDGSDQPCDPSATPFSACIHAGELRRASIAGASSCTGLTLTDSLGVFDWTCELVDTTPTFFAVLEPTKGLRDLVTATGWRDERVMLGGAITAATDPAPWWTNPIVALPDKSTPGSGVTELVTPGTIYVLSSSRATDGYDLADDGVGLVTLAGATLTLNAGGSPIAITATDHDNVWIEASVDATNGHDGIRVTNGRFIQIYGSQVTGGGGNYTDGSNFVIDGVTSSQLRHLVSTNAGGSGLLVGDGAESDDNYIADVAIASPGNSGLYLHYAFHDLFDGITVANGNSDGLSLGPYCDGGGAEYNTFVGVRSFNNVGNGIYENSNGESVIDAIAVGNGGPGITFSDDCGHTHGSIVVDMIAAFNGGIGFNVGEHHISFDNIVSIANAGTGVSMGNGPSTFSNVAVSNSGMTDIDSEFPELFAGNLLVTGSASCINPTVAPGVADGTCAPIGGSTATVYYQGSMITDLVGAISSDASNASATGGTSSYPPGGAYFDWLRFDDRYRVWGLGMPGQWTAGVGSILDFRLHGNGTLIYNNTGSVVAPNPAFVDGGACPDVVDGDNAVDNMNGGYDGFPDQTYLMGAVEIVSPTNPGYGAGNHDGLCESGEHCLYTPNFGAYQGEGALGTCTFHDGTVSGVTMYGDLANGV